MYRAIPFGLRLRIAGLRSWVGRRRVLQRVAKLAVWGLGVLVVLGAARAASDRAEYWGAAREVVVLVREVGPAEPVSRSDLGVESRPIAQIPRDALVAEDLLEANGAFGLARIPLLPGDVLTERDLATGPHSKIPLDHRVISLSDVADLPPVAVGDRVSIYLVDTPRVGAERIDPISGFVTDVGDDRVTVALPEEHLPRAGVALAHGNVLVAVG